MKIIKQDTKEGIIEVVPETLDDLWHLSHIVEGGDNLRIETDCTWGVPIIDF